MSIEEIKKALEGVTPGPWNVYSEKVAEKAEAIAELAYQVEHTEPFVGEIFMLNAGGKCPALTGCGPCSEANARYIAAVNPATISELLFTLESLQRENEALKKDRDFWKEQFQVETRYRIELADRGTLLALTDANSRAEAAEAEAKMLREALHKIESGYGANDICARIARDALSAQVQDVAGWQPIETAPKDGTRLLLMWEPFSGMSEHVELGKWNVRNGWVNTYGHAFSGSPTHFMPLPAAPAKQEG